MFSLRLASSIPPRVRSRALAYYVTRRVELLSMEHDLVTARVAGPASYRVELRRQGAVLEVGCSCGGAAGRQICEHVWATMRTADDAGAFGTPPAVQSAVLAAVMPEPDEPDGDGPRKAETPLALASIGCNRGGDVHDDWRTGPFRPRRLNELAGAIRSINAAYDRSFRGTEESEVLYVLDRETALSSGRVRIEVLRRQRRLDGGWRKPRRWSPEPADIAMIADSAERVAVALLPPEWNARYPYFDRCDVNSIDPHALPAILPALATTGRLFFKRGAGIDTLEPLRYRAEPAFRIQVALSRNVRGRFVPEVTLVRGDERFDAVDSAVILLSGGFALLHDELAPCHGSGALPVLALLGSDTARAGTRSLAPSEARDLVTALYAAHDRPDLQLPAELAFETIVGPPRPLLCVWPEHSEGQAKSRVIGEVLFVYGTERIASGTRAAEVPCPRSRLVVRDVAAEGRALERLAQAGWSVGGAAPIEENARFSVPGSAFVRSVSQLLADGWLVEGEGRRYRRASGKSAWVSSGIDWFDLQAGVEFDGEFIPLPRILAAVRSGEQMIRLGDGSFGLLPQEWLARHALLAPLAETMGDVLRFRRSQALLLDALLAQAERPQLAPAFARLRERLTGGTVTGVDAPRGFRGTLRGYQREGLGWLLFLREVGLGGCLADDMGLGKTIQVLALLAGIGEKDATGGRARPASKPSLVVAPRSVVYNWITEAARFAPELRVVDHTGAARGPASELGGFDLVVTTYGTLRRDATRLAEVSFDTVVLDEAQAIKNPRSQSAKTARLLRADHRLALTGTPVENHLGDLWSLFEFLNPGLLGSAAAFRRCAEAVRGLPGDQATQLARAVRPFLLRRTKREVAPELPARTEQTLVCELDPTERAWYDEAREHYRVVLSAKAATVGIGRMGAEILEALLRLRQLACHPALVDPDRADDSSAKLDILLPLLAELNEEGHKAIVFSQFTALLGLVRRRLDAAGMVYGYLDGSTPAAQRTAAVSRFQEDAACPLFLVSLKAGGFGLNLTAASYVFLLDPWWNPAVEAQAIDRAHRIGQTQPVTAYRLVARDTVEERILELQSRKRALAGALLAETGGGLRGMTPEDLALLLS